MTFFRYLNSITLGFLNDFFLLIIINKVLTHYSVPTSLGQGLGHSCVNSHTIFHRKILILSLNMNLRNIFEFEKQIPDAYPAEL